MLGVIFKTNNSYTNEYGTQTNCNGKKAKTASC